MNGEAVAKMFFKNMIIYSKFAKANYILSICQALWDFLDLKKVRS